MYTAKINRIKGIGYAMISSGTFGLIPLFTIPLITDYKIGLPTILFYRFLLSTVIMGVICLIKKESFRISIKNLSTIFSLGLLYALTAMCLIYAYKYIPSGVATTVHFIYPIAVSFLMVFLFKEKVSVILILAAVLSLLGVGLMCWTNQDGIDIRGIAVASITIFTYAFYIVGVNKTSVSKMGAEILTFYILLSGAVIFLLFALFTTGIERVSGISAWSHLLFLAFLPTVLSDLTLILAIKYAGSTITSILGSMEPLVAVFIGVFYFHEYFARSSFFGLVLIIFAVVLVIVFGSRSKYKEGQNG